MPRHAPHADLPAQPESKEERIPARRQGPPAVHHRYYHTLAAAEAGYALATAELQESKIRVVRLVPPRELCAPGALHPVRSDVFESLSPEVGGVLGLVTR